MEAALPLAALEGQEDLAPAVHVAEPLSVFRVGELLPCVFVNFLVPVQALSTSGQ